VKDAVLHSLKENACGEALVIKRAGNLQAREKKGERSGMKPCARACSKKEERPTNSRRRWNYIEKGSLIQDVRRTGNSPKRGPPHQKYQRKPRRGMTVQGNIKKKDVAFIPSKENAEINEGGVRE